MTGHRQMVAYNRLKTMEIGTKKWSREPTRVSNHTALTGKILVFLNRWSHKQVWLYKLYLLLWWSRTWQPDKGKSSVLYSRSSTTYWPTPKEIKGGGVKGGGGGELDTYQLLSTNKAAQRSPFLAVYEPGSGGLLLNSVWRSSISFSNWPPGNEKKKTKKKRRNMSW